MALSQNALWSDGRLTIGLVLPVRSAAGTTVDFSRQLDLATLTEQLGFGALWVRDVPLNGSWYPEEFGHLDPFVMLGALARSTNRIMLGTAATVLTLREPLLVAKAAASVAALSGGRFILGVGSGDREAEFAAFGKDLGGRRELFRDHWKTVQQHLRSVSGATPATEDYEIRPTPPAPIDMLVVGSAGQTLGWIAENSPGWATYHRPWIQQSDRYALWRQAVDRHASGRFRSFSVAVRIDLVSNPSLPAEPIDLGYRGGAIAVRSKFEAMRENGGHHILINVVPNGRPEEDVLKDFAQHVLPALD